jgi:hypothetical protein
MKEKGNKRHGLGSITKHHPKHDTIRCPRQESNLRYTA